MFKQITCLRALTVIGLLLFFHFHAIVFAGGPIILRPPFAGTFRMTSFFDHEKPNYANDGQITIYTGDTGINSSASNCIPYCYRGHSGYDYALPENTPVLAMADGVIAELNFSTIYYGNNIIIAHANNCRTLYTHLRSSTPFNNLTVGQVVRAVI
jgi:murein DD-endopeptidase MepM/ murein hydrolase activator NlpD